MTDTNDRDERVAEDVLEAFNADEIITNPGELDEPESPAGDSEVPPPG